MTIAIAGLDAATTALAGAVLGPEQLRADLAFDPLALLTESELDSVRRLPFSDADLAAAQETVAYNQREAARQQALAAAGADLGRIRAVGHRVVHGGPNFSDPAVIDDAVVAEIADLTPLAPLHNPGAVAGIQAARTQFAVPHVAVFDTAFFARLPAAAATYAIPRELAEQHRIRRYGFHGTSHRFVSRAAAEFVGDDDTLALAVKEKLPVTEIGKGLRAAGITASKELVSTLVAEAHDHAVRIGLERENRDRIDALGKHVTQLPLLPEGIDQGALFDLAEELRR